jgi:hypothetical protein
MPIIWSILVNKIRTNIPSIFIEITNKINTFAAIDLIEEIIWYTRVYNTKVIKKNIYSNL